MGLYRYEGRSRAGGWFRPWEEQGLGFGKVLGPELRQRPGHLDMRVGGWLVRLYMVPRLVR